MYLCVFLCGLRVLVCSSVAALSYRRKSVGEGRRRARAYGGSEGECLTSDLRYLPEFGWWMESLSLN